MPSSRSPRSRRLAIAGLLTTALAGLSVGSASFVSAGRSGEPSSIALDGVTSFAAGETALVPTIGTVVTFTTSYPKTVKNPRIEVLCYQADGLVYGEAGGVTQAFLLGGGWSRWLEVGGGPADCVANLYYFGSHAGRQTYNVLASTAFTTG
jgi:hypothetical protein